MLTSDMHMVSSALTFVNRKYKNPAGQHAFFLRQPGGIFISNCIII